MAKETNLGLTQTNGAGVSEALGISENDPVNLFAMRANSKPKMNLS